MKRFLIVLVLFLFHNAWSQVLIINELDPDSPSTDTAEFIELKELCTNELFIIDKENEDIEAQQNAISFFDDMAIDRYLRARSNNVKAAFAHIEKSYKWRVKNKPLQIFCSYCMEDRHSHSLRLLGVDKKSQRPVIYSCM